MDSETLSITPTIQIPEGELRFSFSRSSGPGGQNVNKVNTRVELRFDLAASPSIPPGLKTRITRALASRLTKNGEVVVTCGRHRSQARNQEECLARLAKMLKNALARKKRRIPTRPTRSSKEQRLRGKRHRSEKKRRRGRVGPPDG